MAKYKVFIFLLIFEVFQLFSPVAALAISSCTQTNWLGSAWIYRKKINFNNGSQNENLTNFPVLVHLTSSNFEFGKARSSGQDIRFTDSDGTTLLNYEIEKWDQSGGDADVWVNVPQIDASSNTDYIYMYYGNSGAGDGQNINGTWNTNYKAVYHLKESGNGTAGEYKDSTINGNNGQGGNGTSTATPTLTSSGQIDGAQTFDGNDFITTTNNDTDLDANGQYVTAETWFTPNTISGGAMALISKDGANSSGWTLFSNNTQVLFFYKNSLNQSAFLRTNNSLLSAGLRYYAVVVFRADTSGTTNNDAQLYLNGGLDQGALTNSTAAVISSVKLKIGARSFDSSPFSFLSGSEDEVRVSNTSRSANWIAATYKSETDTFNSYNQEEGYRSECPPAPPAVSTCSDTAPGSAPTISSTSSGVNSVTLNWIKASDPVSYYAIEYGTTSGSYQYGASNIGNVTTYTVNSLSPKTTYYFRVRAGNGCTPGAWSNEVSSTTSGGVVVLPVSTPTPIPTEIPSPTTTPSPTPTPIAPTEIPTPSASPVSFKFELPKIRLPQISINLFPVISAINKLFINSATRIIDAIRSIAFGIKNKGSDLLHYSKEAIAYAGLSISKSFQKPSEFTKRIGDWITYSTVSFKEIVLDTKPTEISDVNIEKLTPTSVTVTWKTNHLATSKVNYGETLVYGKDVQSDTKVHDHSLVLTNLKPNTKYYFEVMSQNKNYVYDAHHEFTTPLK